jgi:hypothetical protein
VKGRVVWNRSAVSITTRRFGRGPDAGPDLALCKN